MFQNSEMVTFLESIKRSTEITVFQADTKRESPIETVENVKAETLDKRGWLMKKGKRRYFMLKNDVLLWFTQEQPATVSFQSHCCKPDFFLAKLQSYKGQH